MSPRLDAFQDWQQRCERYRRFSTLLGEDETTAPLHALVLDMQQHQEKWRALVASREQRQHWRSVLLAEIDTLLMRSRGALFCSRNLLRPFSFSAEDIREESRLCQEEAKTTEDIETRRALASRALRLAIHGGEFERARRL